ncbi:hypothetical protein GCM10023336_42300 [Streptomyces similanensis]|uniref:Uncharacterized protein n=1 Tax=Streptomyces similanensis TaxID=1274988 RepID=A0ABP9KT52_9ACTN
MRYYHVFTDTVLAHAALDAETRGLGDADAPASDAMPSDPSGSGAGVKPHACASVRERPASCRLDWVAR